MGNGNFCKRINKESTGSKESVIPKKWRIYYDEKNYICVIFWE